MVRKTAPSKGMRLRIRQVRSGNGRPQVHRDTLRALGLKHHQDIVVQPDNEAIRGMVFKVPHLVDVTEVAEGEE